MIAEDVQRLVLEEIDEQWERWTSHGLDLRRCIVTPPRRETYLSHTKDGDVPLELWLVLEESPETHDGYEVFYDEQEATFGLGTVDRDGGRYYVGAYGTLWDTLEGM